MTKAHIAAADRFKYLRGHCDSDEESELIDWAAQHIADAFKQADQRFSFDAWLRRTL